jgi:hypothetical protein
VGRFLVPGHALSLAGTYEAFAHIWVGAMIVYVIFRCRLTWDHLDGWLAAGLLLALTVQEGIMFAQFKGWL